MRPLEEADLDRAAELLVRSWARTYGDIVPHEQQPSLEEQRSHLADTPDSQGWVYEVASDIAALAFMTRLDSDDPELSALHVAPAAQGAGVGTIVHDQLIDALREMGHRRLHLWVFVDNGQARAFYGSRGWIVDEGESAAPERCAAAPVLRMTRTI